MEKLAHGKDWTIDSFSERVNSRDDLAKAVFDLANDLHIAMKWIEKVHGDHFAAVKELAEARKDNGNEAINAVVSLKTAIDEKIVEPAVKLAEATEANGKTLDWTKIEFKKSISDTVSKTVRAERKKERLIEENKNSFMVFGVREEFLGEGEDNTFWSNKEELAMDLLEECDVDRQEFVKVEKLGLSGNAPMKVTLINSRGVQKVLKNAYKLRGYEDPYNQVFIAPNRTKEQQAVHQQLVKKMREKVRMDPSKRWIIRDGAIVDYGPFKRKETNQRVWIRE